MLQKITPRNNEWNRKNNFMDENSSGYLIETKNGMSYFAWKFKTGMVSYYKCEEPVFEKSFHIEAETVMLQAQEEGARHYRRYPVEV